MRCKGGESATKITAHRAAFQQPLRYAETMTDDFLPYLAPSDPFPDPSRALGDDSDAPGLLCAGADLSVTRLRLAYQAGIFPWFSEGQPPLWWSPNPRMVLVPNDFHLPRSLAQRIRQTQRLGWRIETDRATPAVIQACAHTPRPGQSGTWIVQEMVLAYERLAAAGHVHSIEVWQGAKLLGGLYCVNFGQVVFGESMFFNTADASKVALCALVALCRAQGVAMIDCQQQTANLARFGAKPIARKEFLQLVKAGTEKQALCWKFDPLYWHQLIPAAPDAQAS